MLACDMAARVIRCIQLCSRIPLITKIYVPPSLTRPLTTSQIYLKTDPVGKPFNLPDFKQRPQKLPVGENQEGFEEVELIDEDGVDIGKGSVMFPDGESMKWDRDAEAFPDIQLSTHTINFGPQHPAAHGVLRLILEMEGEVSMLIKCIHIPDRGYYIIPLFI